MKEKDVILNYKIEKTLDPAQRNKLIEAKIIITPHPRFAGEVISGNKRIANIMQFPVTAKAEKFAKCKSELPPTTVHT